MPDDATVPVIDAGEIARLNKIIDALMNRAERGGQETDYGLFQKTILLEEEVHRRTASLEAALQENARITRALRQSEAIFHGLVNQSLIGIAIIENGRFSYSNPKFNEMLGYTPEEMRRLGPTDVTAEGDRSRVKEAVRQRETGEVDHLEYAMQGLRKDGRIIDLEIHGGAMTVEGRRLLISLVLDVTERVRADREIRALKDALQEQAIHDQLTGLYNRRFLDESLPRELLRAKRSGSSVSAVMGDLDHFKNVNDRYGHAAGDAVLRSFGALFRQHSRASDIYCRYGGEEFLLILPETEEPVACNRAEELRAGLAAIKVATEAGDISVTASFGVATFPRDAATGDALIAAADKALYAAKAAGRNRVTACSSL